MHLTSLGARTKTSVFAATIIATLFFSASVSAQGQGGPNRPNTETVEGREVAARQVIVKFTRPLQAAEQAQLNQQLDADRNEDIGGAGARLVHSRIFDTPTLMNFFATRPNVAYVEPDYIVQAIQTPNDPKFSQLWGLQNNTTPGADIHAAAAWDVSTGSRANVVAVIDTGIDYTHPDLAANIWSAPASFNVTIRGTTITCAIGTHGFNTITQTCNPMDDNNHGSHVSGTIGGVGNNGVGVAGVNWTASIIGAKFLNSAGSGSTSGAIDAIEFLIQAKNAFSASNGANIRVLSNSWGGGGFSQALLDEINKANTNGMLFVAAAGNNGTNNDTSPFYPAGYTAPNVISVAATTSTDDRASFSNHGASTVDLGAPGAGIVSTTIGNTYSSFSGTSMATPHVSGAAALVLSTCALDTAALKSNLLSTVDPIASLSGITVTGGRLNVSNAINACGSVTPTTPPAPTGLAATPGNTQISLSWSAPAGAASYNVKRSQVNGGPYTTVGTPGSTSFTNTGLSNGTLYYYVVTAVNADGESGNSNQASATPVAPTTPSAPTALTATSGPGKKKISLAWTGSSGATSYIVKRSTAHNGPYTNIAVVSGTTYANTGIANGTYYYVVSAQNSVGQSADSNEASATAK